MQDDPPWDPDGERNKPKLLAWVAQFKAEKAAKLEAERIAANRESRPRSRRKAP